MHVSKETAKKLLALAAYVEKQPEEKFDMDTWFSHYGDDDHDHHLKNNQVLTKRHLNLCGTTACALGHCAVSPLGRKLGLSLVYDKEENWGDVRMKGMPKDADALEIAVEAFGISYPDAEYLFGGGEGGDTPQEWAKLCRNFVQDGPGY